MEVGHSKFKLIPKMADCQCVQFSISS